MFSKGFLNDMKRHNDYDIVYDEQEEEDNDNDEEAEEMVHMNRRSTQRVTQRESKMHQKDRDTGYKSDDDQKYHKKSIQIDDVEE